MTSPQREVYKRAVLDRIDSFGEFVKHKGSFGEEWVKLHFTDIPRPSDVSGIEIGIVDANPFLTGHVDQLVSMPEPIRKNNQYSAASGSVFIVNGISYDVQSFDVNMRGGFKIDLVVSNPDDDVDASFFAEQMAQG
ncbi:MAG: hypothetical protein ACRBHB_18105 [Arenicella sp.]